VLWSTDAKLMDVGTLERMRGEGWGQDAAPKCMSPRTHSLQLVPSLLNSSSNYEPISGLINWWSQNPHDLITSPKWALLNIAKSGTKPSTHEPLGKHLDPNHNIHFINLSFKVCTFFCTILVGRLHLTISHIFSTLSNSFSF
jgi:hypothetical protein